MKKLSIILLTSILFASCVNHHIVNDIEPFSYDYSDGEILYPDYAHTETLIVIDSEGLNKAMAMYQPESDGEIFEILSQYTSAIESVTGIAIMSNGDTAVIVNNIIEAIKQK